jgi:AraC-like DNA-binding protein
MSLEISTRSETVHAGRLDCKSLEELADATSGWEFDWRQLDRGPLRANLLQVETSSTLVSQFRFNRKFHQRGTSPPGMRTFGIVGAQSTPVAWNGREWLKDHIEVFPADDLYEAVSHPGFQGNGVSISEGRIRSTADTLGLPDPLERLPVGSCFVEAGPMRMQVLRRGLAKLYSAVSDPNHVPLDEKTCSELDFEIRSSLVFALTSGLDINVRPPAPTVRSRALRLALDYIEANADDAPTVKDICRTTGSSYRTLNYAFLDRFGVAPKQYLQATRLDGVRKELRRKGPSAKITDVANHWGFWHMGQFAADYKRQFGELPSETQKQVGRP